MPNPYSPAMDPQIERAGIWEIFHSNFIARLGDLLNQTLPDNYVAVSKGRTRLTTDAEEAEWDEGLRRALGTSRRSDVLISGIARTTVEAEANAAPVATLEPRETVLSDDPYEVTQRYINVLHLPEQRVVTSIELLSPSNKYEPSRQEYLESRRQVRRAGVNLLEIDLLLKGRRPTPTYDMPDDGYCALLSRRELYPKLLIYSWPAGDPLPTLPVPLLPPDADVALELRPLVDEVYDRGRYKSLLKYDVPAPPAS